MIPEVRRAAVVAVGDELTSGVHPDLNSSVIASRLLEIGFETDRFIVVGDETEELATLFYELCSERGLVVCTGGLGPTLDDVTREAAARAAGVGLRSSPEVLEGLKKWFEARGRVQADSNARQAQFPEGAQIMENRIGTAPGFRVWIGGGVLAALPGPPREMRAMLEAELLPWVEATCGSGDAFAGASFHLLGLGESAFADLVGDWMVREANPRMSVTAKSGVLSVTLRAWAGTPEGAASTLADRAAELRERVGEYLFSEDDPRPAFALGRVLLRSGSTVATAESCTGGLVAEMLTRVPGISEAFLEGFVTYSNRAKTERLGVPAETIERYGAVSCEVAEAMARGAAERAGADLAVSVTGVAGLGGGTEAKPVGTVCFGVLARGSVRTVEKCFPPVDRETVRRFAAHTALDLLRRAAAGREEPAGD